MLSNPEVLDEEFVPERELVVHRRAELDRLLETLRPVGTGPADVVYLLGPTGTGKTMLARLALDLLLDDARVDDATPVYVNCWQHYERLEILYEIADGLKLALPHRQGTSRGEVLSKLDEPDTTRYVVLDEADQITATEVLYDLYEAPDLHLVLVANREQDLFEDMAPRLRSRLTVGTRIECGRYSTEELTEILAKRAEAVLGLVDGDDRRVLEYIAGHAGGDARVAIRTLRELLTERELAFSREAVDEALPAARDQLRQKSLDALNPHQRTLYQLITEHAPVNPQTLYAQYRDRVEEPRTERTLRAYLSKLEQYNLIDSEGETSRRTYTVVGE